MPLPKPAVRQTVEPLLVDDSVCRVKQVVPTATVFAAALERMNRRSALTLFQELAQELEEHARTLADTRGSASDVSPLRVELTSLLAWLRQMTEQHQAEAARVKQQLVDLQERGTQAQADFEKHLGALIGAQIEQHLARAITDAGARHEKILGDALERSLQSFCGRATLRERSGWRRGLLLGVLALLLIGGFFALGAYVACRASSATCAPAVSARSAAGLTAGAGVLGTPAWRSQPEATATAALTQVTSERQAASLWSPRVEAADSKTCQVICAAQSAGALPTTAFSEPLAVRSAQPPFVPQPGTMESDLLAFFQRPAPRVPQIFTLDRLRYPSASHEVNPEGKEQIFRVAQILLLHPAVRIEIRGHSDGTESEIYTGPKPIPGYSLSQLRANCVMQRLQGMKVPIDRMRIRGEGSTQPVADDRTPEGRQHNRRVEIVVLSS